MHRRRFEQIYRKIYLVDNSTLVTDKRNLAYNKIAKVRWLVEDFIKISKRLYNCDRHMCVDEIMISYQGRRYDIKQYMKAKPIIYGIKVWCAVDSKSRYIHNLQVYTGRKGELVEKDLGRKVVLSLVDDLQHRGHVVVTDRFFTSPRLFDDLLKRGFLATGTIMHNRVGMPLALGRYHNNHGVRGGMIAKMHRSRRIADAVWFDGVPVYLLSTSLDPIGTEASCLRWTSRQG
jgi:hypothetical protein